MPDIMTYTFSIKGNINQEDIDNFIDFYQNVEDNPEGVCNKDTGELFDKIEIIIEPSTVYTELYAEIDPLFLGYLVLLLNRFDKVNAVFRLTNPFLNISNHELSEGDYQKSKKISDRAFSLNDQISFISNFLGFGNRISLIAGWYKKETKQVFPVLKSSAISQRFFPIILINSKESINHYFDSKSKKNEIEINYFNRVEEIVKVFKSISIAELNILETFILRLLLSDDNPVVKSKKLTKEVINYYLKYSNELASGIKELALNIVEHSRLTNDSKSGIGVITGRIFDKERLLALKGPDDKSFLKRFEDSAYFLDINIIDLGIKGVREKYIENIKENWENDKENAFKINYRNDIEIIQNKVDFGFEDFYIPNTKTEHQLNKLISRYGLQYFTHILTHRFDAYVKVISADESLIFEGKQPEIKSYRFTRAGTSYSCIIPLDSFNIYYRSAKPKSPIPTRVGEHSNLLIELHNHKGSKSLSGGSINHNELILFDDFPQITDNKYEFIKEIYFRFLKINEGLRRSIFLINADNSPIKSPTDWLRLLSQISLEFKNIIVFNIEKNTTKELIDNRRIQSTIPQINFWDEESCVLFYSTKTDMNTGYYRYGASVLTGKNEGQYNFVNINVWKNHYSYYEGFLDNSVLTEEFYPKSHLFVNGNLKYFELLIKNRDKYGSAISLFETSLQYALNKPLPDNLLKDTNNKGYKIDKTHFRLGSKIHIESFYYAKRVFQNSFFTTPLAFLLADNIHEYIIESNSLETKPKITGFTLIGYEDYSELLLSTTRSLLSKMLGKEFIVSHNTFNSNSSLSRPLESIQNNIFIIVPIASSFSTSIKIKNELHYIFNRNDETKEKNIKFLEPHLNLILVGDLEFESKTISTESEGFFDFNDNTLKDYGWHSIDKIKKIVKINEFGDIKKEDNQGIQKHVRQKYFIPVYSKWNKADDCVKCFPAKIVEEKCLVETGQASISPKLIFGLPKTKPNKNSANILDLTDSIFYGNLKKGNNRYLYYTRVGEIINKRSDNYLINHESIKKWLEKIKENFRAIPEFMNQKVVIVTPSSSTASNFIDMVNEYVFHYTANCLTISLHEDYIENSESLYADGLHKADIVIYVDDVLLTTKSFLEINYIIKYIRKKLGKGSGIDYCITLINRMTFDSEENVLLKLAKLDGNIQDNLKTAVDKLLYFTKINNPSIEEPNGDFPLISESARYKILSDTSSIDSIRSVFFEKFKKLREHNLLIKKDQISIKSEVDDTSFYNNKKLYQLLILDKLYTLFEYDWPEYNLGSEETVDEYNDNRSKKIDGFFLTKDDPLNSEIFLGKFRELAEEIRGEFFEKNDVVNIKYKIYEKILRKYDHNLDYVILKLLCSTPLIYYKQLRESAFYWFIAVLEKLKVGWDDYKIIGINNLDSGNLINYFKVDGLNYYSEYQKLKFLLKRSVQLKSNYLIHKDFLESIKKLINLLYNNIDSLQEVKEVSEDKLVEKINELFNSQYTKGHIKLYEYVLSLNKTYLLSDKRADEIKNKQVIELLAAAADYDPPTESGILQFAGEDPLEHEFDKAFDEIKRLPKYRLITSKKLIYDLICLTKELVYHNEPKAIKLEKNIDEIQEEESNRNGDFSHFLRLLKLENTTAIDSFWNYFYDKEKDHDKEIIEIDKIDKIEQYEYDPKFKAIVPLIKINDNYDSFKGFLKLMAELTNLEINRTGKSKTGSLGKEVKEILEYTSTILGGTMEHCYLSVNFKYMINPDAADIFFFDGHHTDAIVKESYSFYEKSNIASSLNYLMYSGITENCYDKYPLSNFEIIRKEKKLYFRKDTNIETKDEISKSPELAVNKHDCNILLIRISDFTDSFPRSFRDKKHDEKDLVTQSVLTFKLSQNTRVDIKKLRLLLLLRGPLSRFIHANILSNNMIEYIKNKSDERYQSKLKHNIINYIGNQNLAYKKGRLEEVEIINNAIAGQIHAYKINLDAPLKKVSKSELEDRLRLLLKSEFIYKTNLINDDQCIISLNSEQDDFYFYKFVYDVVLTEVIINTRRWGTLNIPFVWIYSEDNWIVVKNIQFDSKFWEFFPGKGIEMCNEILEKYLHGLKLEIHANFLEPETNTYFFIVKIPLRNEKN